MRSPRVLMALALGVTIASCGATSKPCGPTTCSGCCDEVGECRTGTNLYACGAGGNACAACEANLVCRAGACELFDGGVYDASFPDKPDAQVLDAGVYDAGRGVDAGTVDAGSPDAGRRDGGVSYVLDVAPIFTTHCSACHNWSYSTTVNAASACGGQRIVPGNPNTSVLYGKVAGTPACGASMPPNGQLTAAQLSTLLTWINEGARNN